MNEVRRSCLLHWLTMMTFNETLHLRVSSSSPLSQEFTWSFTAVPAFEAFIHITSLSGREVPVLLLNSNKLRFISNKDT